MRLLLDEHFSPRIATEMRKRGHDVTAARALPAVHGLSDAELLELATSQRRALVTENVADFVELHRAAVVSGRRLFGLIFTSPRRFPRTSAAIGKLVHALDTVLTGNPRDDALVGQTLWLADPEDGVHTPPPT
jgi:hypothetical protein